MGVIYLAKWVYDKYRNSFTLIKDEFKENIDEFLIDLNAIIHPAVDRYIDKQKGTVFHKKKISYEETRCFEEICSFMKERIDLVNPKNRIVLAIDGVSGLAKATQQRQRRFKSVYSTEKTYIDIFREEAIEDGTLRKIDNKTVLDKNCISVGTKFMNKLSSFIIKFIKLKLKNEWKSLKIVFSSDKSIMEGEHKLLKYIKQRMMINPKLKFCIDSPDADLIILLLGIKKKGLFLFKTNIYKEVDAKYLLINIETLREDFIKEMKWEVSISKKSNEISSIDDLILLSFFLGNDFLPVIPSIDIRKNGYGNMIKFGILTSRNVGYIVRRSTQDNKEIYELNFNSLLYFVNNMMTNENMDEKYKANYYKSKGITNIDDVCYKYIEGLLFILKYYLSGIPDWEWFYPFNGAPFFQDLSNYLNTHRTILLDIKFSKHEILTPFQQLLSVLPPQSNKLLPKSLRYLVTDKDSPIVDLFPAELKKDDDDEYIVPFISVNRIKEAYKNSKITEVDKNNGRTAMILSSIEMKSEFRDNNDIIPPVYEDFVNDNPGNIIPYPIFEKKEEIIKEDVRIEYLNL